MFSTAVIPRRLLSESKEVSERKRDTTATINHAVRAREYDRLSPRLGEVYETIDRFASHTPFIFSLVVLQSRDVVPPPRHCLADNINGIRITGEKERERERESEVSDTIVSKSFLATPVIPETLLFRAASASLPLLASSIRE